MENSITTFQPVLPDPIKADPLTIRMDKAQFPRIKDYSREAAIAKLGGIILMATMYRNTQLDETMMSFTATALLDELLEDPDGLNLPYLTFEEITRAVKKAVLGQGKEMYGVSVASLYQIVADFAKGEGHILSKQDDAIRKKEKMESFKDSTAGIMTQVMAAQMARTNKI